MMRSGNSKDDTADMSASMSKIRQPSAAVNFSWKNEAINGVRKFVSFMSSMRMAVLVILCLQNSLFTVLRRYSQGVLREVYSKHEVLLVGEIIKIVFSAWMISKDLPDDCPDLKTRLNYLVKTSKKMYVLSFMVGFNPPMFLNCTDGPGLLC